MKYLFIPLMLFLLSCGEESTTEDENSPEAEIIPEDVIVDCNLNIEESSISWERFLDQKATKKKVKLFGAMVDMEMGPVTLTMNGEVTPLKGGIKLLNDVYNSGNLIFDMKTFKFAEERGQGLFNTKDYPESELKFDEFKELKGDKENNYTVSMTLTIQKHSETITAPMSVKSDGKSCSIIGDFKFNTLDFPLRDNAKKSEVNKDEITVLLNLKYLMP